MKTLVVLLLLISSSLFGQDIFVPNAFTPDGDGTNDVFQVYTSGGDSLTHYELRIYNMWGDLIFKTNQINQPWIGGKEHFSPLTSYVYYLEYSYEKYEIIRKTGFVNILR